MDSAGPDISGCRKIAVPMCFWPGLSVPCGWDTVSQAATYVDILILNPDSGPGKERIETFSIKADLCRAAGQRVLGYVCSSYVRRDITEVLRDIEKYRTWVSIDGFFIDEIYCVGMVFANGPQAAAASRATRLRKDFCRYIWS